MQANPAIMLAIVKVDDDSTFVQNKSTDNLLKSAEPMQLEQYDHKYKDVRQSKKNHTTMNQSPAHLFEDDQSCRSSQQGGIAYKNVVIEAYEDATVVLKAVPTQITHRQHNLMYEFTD